MSCQGALSPIPLGCQVSSPFSPCYQSSSEYTIEENPVCDILPKNVLNSLPTLMANLPLTLLFIVTLPTRFFLCLIYNFYQFIVKGGITRLINGLVADAINPVACFADGVAEGNSADFFAFQLPSFSPPNLSNESVVPGVCSSNPFIQAICDITYGIGYILGIISSLINQLTDAIIVLICVLFNLTIEFGVCLGPIHFVTCISASNVFNALGLKINCALNCYCAIGKPPILKISNCPYSVCSNELCCNNGQSVNTVTVTCPTESYYSSDGAPCVRYYTSENNGCVGHSVCCPSLTYSSDGQICVETFTPTPNGCVFQSYACSSDLYYANNGVPCQGSTCCPPSFYVPERGVECVTVYEPSDGQCVPVNTQCYPNEQIVNNAPCNGTTCCPAVNSNNNLVIYNAQPGKCVPVATLQNST